VDTRRSTSCGGDDHGYNRQAEIDVLRHGQGQPASQLVPPGILHT
jgi:hypothetical protein